MSERTWPEFLMRSLPRRRTTMQVHQVERRRTILNKSSKGMVLISKKMKKTSGMQRPTAQGWVVCFGAAVLDRFYTDVRFCDGVVL